MFDSPSSLKDICIDYVSENIFAIYSTRTSVEGRVCRVLSTDDEFYLPSNIAEELVVALSDKGKIEDSTLMLFDAKITRLENVFLRNASKLTINGLRTLQSHKISHLEVTGLKHATVSDLIGCLGEWTLQNLQTLNVANSTFVDKEGNYNVSSLSKLRNLRTLNVRNTEFNDKGLEIVVDNSSNLKNLDVSETRVCNIASLKKCNDRLRSLFMYNLPNSCGVDMIDVICDLHHLQHLDISCSHCQISNLFGPRMSDFLRFRSCHPFLTSLDISGIEQISIENLRYFLVKHREMRFLGLTRNELCNDEMFTDSNHRFYNPDLVVAGCANEAQILEVLRRYPHRVILCRVAMDHLFPITENCDGLRLDIISVILHAMKTNPKDLIIQIYALRCLGNFFEGQITRFDEINCWFKQIVESMITAMENFPTVELLLDTCLTILENAEVLECIVIFDKYRYHLVCLLMDTLCTFDDEGITKRTIDACEFATQWTSISENTRIGANPVYMKKLLFFIQNFELKNDIDFYVLKRSLEMVHSLSENIFETCRVLINENGLNVFTELIGKFGTVSIATCVLKVMLNIAEFNEIRFALMTQNILPVVRSFINSSNIDVSYHAAGITAFLASDGERAWTVTSVSRAEMLKKLGTAVISWQAYQVYGIIEFKTFKRLYPLFLCYEMKEIQLWAVWTVRHSCKLDTKVCSKILSDEDGVEKLQEMLSHPQISEEVREICGQILDIVKD